MRQRELSGFVALRLRVQEHLLRNPLGPLAILAFAGMVFVGRHLLPQRPLKGKVGRVRALRAPPLKQAILFSGAQPKMPPQGLSGRGQHVQRMQSREHHCLAAGAL